MAANTYKAELSFINLENPEWRDEFTPEQLAALDEVDVPVEDVDE